ncbi:nuclear receptor subfamily 1 group I member 3 isoform X3 [Ursus arctos]|uniref:nuclear receptor subfamily 1 group I member 3 isoform X3 n=1 Tax=Ursus arctos TaxID=9644 RepID=UPI002548C700|nr:nuclear receptor subfamily 1 group I member 3 isoform X3 [Ursus arctos]
MAIATSEAMAGGEDGPRSCMVCGDRATGYHFHALTCEGCKGFFRRTVSKSTDLTCPFAGSCKVNKAQRRHCPACRLQKCLEAGMKKEMILSAEALAMRRAKQAQRRAQQAPAQLSKEQQELVQTLLGAHTRHVGTMFDQFVQFRPPAHLFTHHQRLPITVPVLPLLVHFAEVNTFMVQQVIKFTKDLPLFRSLPMEDQISLLKGAAVEICHIALNTTFCLQTQNFFCGPLRYTLEDGVHAGFQEEFLELLFRFHATLRRLQLQEPEYVLMAAMALFSPDRPGVTQREEIDRLQEVMALTLHGYIKGQPPRPGHRYGGAWGLGGCVRAGSEGNTAQEGCFYCPFLWETRSLGGSSPSLTPHMLLASKSLLLLFHLIFSRFFFYSVEMQSSSSQALYNSIPEIDDTHHLTRPPPQAKAAFQDSCLLSFLGPSLPLHWPIPLIFHPPRSYGHSVSWPKPVPGSAVRDLSRL